MFCYPVVNLHKKRSARIAPADLKSKVTIRICEAYIKLSYNDFFSCCLPAILYNNIIDAPVQVFHCDPLGCAHQFYRTYQSAIAAKQLKCSVRFQLVNINGKMIVSRVGVDLNPCMMAPVIIVARIFWTWAIFIAMFKMVFGVFR